MLISYKWLKEYVDIKESPETLGGMLTMAGLPVESMKELSGGHALELEVTANRPDWLSYIGVAREVAAITGRKLRIPSACHCDPAHSITDGGRSNPKKSLLRRKIGLHHPSRNDSIQVTIKVEDKSLCPRYTARIIRDVKIGESPAWLKERLESMGLRPVNNVVDITNFCLFETGEPMHAFDLDKISGREIVVRKAEKSEKIVSIDGIERSLSEDMLVIADNSRTIAIAGVMGGLNTEVNHSTKNILLEAAYFDPISIRRTSRKLALSTESSYRFERRVDISNIRYSSDRAAGLICEIAGGEFGEMIDIGIKPAKRKPIILRNSKLCSVLGFDIPAYRSVKILKALGLSVKSSSKDKSAFTAPAFRNDLNCEVDLIEEVARIFGYNRIPGTVPPVTGASIKPPPDTCVSSKIKKILTGAGYDEIITYSLLSKKTIDASGVSAQDAVTLRNPLSTEQETMRPSLIPGMLGAVLWNISRRSKDIKFFEVGHIYAKEKDSFTERQSLCLCITGGILSWAGGSRAHTFFDLKGTVETLFDSLKIGGIIFASSGDKRFSSASSASIGLNGKDIGIIGEVDGRILTEFGIKEPVYICEICAESLLPSIGAHKRFSELPKYPAVSRDISIIVDKVTKNADIALAIAGSAGEILKDVKLIDRYSGKQISGDKISLTYRIEYQSPAKTLEEKDILETHNNILRSLEAKFGAKLR